MRRRCSFSCKFRASKLKSRGRVRLAACPWSALRCSRPLTYCAMRCVRAGASDWCSDLDRARILWRGKQPLTSMFTVRTAERGMGGGKKPDQCDGGKGSGIQLGLPSSRLPKCSTDGFERCTCLPVEVECVRRPSRTECRATAGVSILETARWRLRRWLAGPCGSTTACRSISQSAACAGV